MKGWAGILVTSEVSRSAEVRRATTSIELVNIHDVRRVSKEPKRMHCRMNNAHSLTTMNAA